MGGKARIVITAIMDVFFMALSAAFMLSGFPPEGSKGYILTILWACFALYFAYSAVRKAVWLFRNR